MKYKADEQMANDFKCHYRKKVNLQERPKEKQLLHAGTSRYPVLFSC